MDATLTIIEYLYTGRNTWLRCSEECSCPVEERIKQALDQVPVDQWLDFHEASSWFLRKTADQWNEICGPAAEKRIISEMVETLLSKASDLIAASATKERLSGE